jgi:hypothetical protein
MAFLAGRLDDDAARIRDRIDRAGFGKIGYGLAHALGELGKCIHEMFRNGPRLT